MKPADEQALRETLRRVFATNTSWTGADGRTKVGRLQRDAHQKGFIIDEWSNHGAVRFRLTPKGRWFIDG